MSMFGIDKENFCDNCRKEHWQCNCVKVSRDDLEWFVNGNKPHKYQYMTDEYDIVEEFLEDDYKKDKKEWTERKERCGM